MRRPAAGLWDKKPNFSARGKCVVSLGSLSVLIVVALVTMLTRGLPYLLFGGNREVPGFLRYLGAVLPASIMVVLVVHCLRHVKLTTWPYGIAELSAVAVVVAAQVLKKSAILSVFLGTALYMFLIRLL